MGKRLGGYEIRRRLGSGGSGTVYLAHQVRLDRAVALKLLDTANASEQDLAAFEQEARAAAAIDHPNLVRVFDIGEAEGHHYFAMELVRGGNLATRIRRQGPLPWNRACEIAIDVAEALAQAHGQRFVHGDVKPANVLLTEEGHAKLADLGLVRHAGRQDGRVVGSIAFLSPEQLQLKPSDARSDLYALGCTLFMMLTGKKVFDRANSKLIALAHVTDTPPVLARLGVEVPPRLQQLLDALLAKKPDERPADAKAVIRELRDVLDARSAPQRTRRQTRRRPGRRQPNAVYALIYLILIAAVILGTLWMTGKL